MVWVSDRGFKDFGTGVFAAARNSRDAVLGQRPEDRDLAMVARIGSLLKLRLTSEDVGTIGDAAFSKRLKIVYDAIVTFCALTFIRLVGWAEVRKDVRRGSLASVGRKGSIFRSQVL
uniref:Polyketide synthase n=1 Tax=Peronospora matthiolae TaxID=2874970 RepID=A0AAV1TMQ9_9STRA